MSDAVRQIILDTETTGFNHSAAENPDRIIEFAGVEMHNRQYTGNSLQLYIHPERDIPQEAINVHNITLEKLIEVNAPPFAQVAQQIFDFIKGAQLLIHNAAFDVSFLDAEFARVGLPKVHSVCDVVDTLEMARKRYPGQKNTLDALCERLGVNNSHRIYHGALLDCELLGEVYLAMTRNQLSMMDVFDQAAVDLAIGNLPPRPDVLRVLLANEEECVAHEAYLDEIDKASNHLTLYRQAQSESQ